MSARPIILTCDGECTSPDQRQTGIALITCLLILVMLTLLVITMFRGYGLQEKIAGSTREKERAFQSAENALQYGEWWLSLGTAGTGVNCGAPKITVLTTDNMRACLNAITDPSDPAGWDGSLIYTPPAMKVATGGGTATDGNGNLDINYSQSPNLYISYLGLSPDRKQMLYNVASSGYGGSSSSTSVVQSIYSVSSKTPCFSCDP